MRDVPRSRQATRGQSEKEVISAAVRIHRSVCHATTQNIRQGFAEVVELHTKDVDHSRESMNLEELLASRIARMGKPTLELFVMSYCPYGVQAEEAALFRLSRNLATQLTSDSSLLRRRRQKPSPHRI